MKSALGNIDDLDGVLNVVTIASQCGVQHIPKTRTDYAKRDHPDQRVPNAVTALATTFDLTLHDQRTNDDTDHHDYAIPAQREFSNCKNYRIYHVYLEGKFSGIITFKPSRKLQGKNA